MGGVYQYPPMKLKVRLRVIGIITTKMINQQMINQQMVNQKKEEDAINPKKVGNILKVEVEDQLKVEDIEKVESKSKKPKPQTTNPKTHFNFRHTTEG